jgi:hypothetical protein
MHGTRILSYRWQFAHSTIARMHASLSSRNPFRFLHVMSTCMCVLRRTNRDIFFVSLFSFFWVQYLKTLQCCNLRIQFVECDYIFRIVCFRDFIKIQPKNLQAKERWSSVQVTKQKKHHCNNFEDVRNIILTFVKMYLRKTESHETLVASIALF